MNRSNESAWRNQNHIVHPSDYPGGDCAAEVLAALIECEAVINLLLDEWPSDNDKPRVMDKGTNAQGRAALAIERAKNDKTMSETTTTKAIGAPNSVARYLSGKKFGFNKFVVMERIGGELELIAAQTTIEEAKRYMLPGRELIDTERCLILHEHEMIGARRVRSFCTDLGGGTKCQLFTEPATNPITAAEFGEETWCVWEASEPQSVRRFLDEERARAYYMAAMVHGTNGRG